MRAQYEAFVSEYLKDFNATRAAIRAGYSAKTARSKGSQLLTIVDIKDAIRAHLDELLMSAEEAQMRLSDIARGDLSDLMDVTSVGWSLDMQKAKERGKTGLIKKVKQTTITKIGRKQDDDDEERTYLEVELYPADAALRDVLKIHGKFVDRTDITTGGEKIESLNDERFDRAISTLADALRESISGKGTEQNSEMDTAE